MKNIFILFFKKLAILFWVSGMVTLLFSLISFMIDIPFKDIMSFFNNEDYFWFDGQRIAYLSVVPFFMYIIFISLTILFTKDNQFPKKLNGASNFLAITTLMLLVLFSLLSLLFYLYIVIFTQYKSCKEPTFTNYFATDYKICKTIINSESD